MACERWREMLSAQLDGEGADGEAPAAERHLAGCRACQEWFERAAAVNRLTRTGVGVPVPDLTELIMAGLPPEEPAPGKRAGKSASGIPARWWRRIPAAAVLYVALAMVGAVQLILGLRQVGGGVAGAHPHLGLDATPGHLWHESAAWNVAVGAGYLFIAIRRTRPAGLVPMLSAFVGMLLLLSVNDLTGGRVDATRLVSHGLVILGYLLVVTLSRVRGGFAQPPGRRAGSGWRFGDDEGEGGEGGRADVPRPGLRLVRPGPLTARHDDRRAA